MNVHEMSIRARNSMLPPYLKRTDFSEKEQIAVLYTDLLLSISELMLNSRGGDQTVILDNYCNGLCRFLLVASQQNIMDKFLLTDEELKAMKNKWPSKSFNTLYLILNQQIENSYFRHQKDALIHAWHMYIKFGLVDLQFSGTQIEKHFLEMFAY